MKPVSGPLESDRKANMMGRSYIYPVIIGVVSDFQRQGFGGKLLRALIEKSEQTGTPLYSVTMTERNVRLFEILGFKLLNQITLPVINLSQWEILRKPRA